MKIIFENLSKILIIDYALLIIRLLISGFYILAGITKLLELKGFIQIVHRFEILPERMVPYFSIILPTLELFFGLCLFFGLYHRWTIKFLIILVNVFIIVITVTMIRGISVNCGCFGGLFDDVIGLETLIRDFFLLGLLVLLMTQKKLLLVIN